MREIKFRAWDKQSEEMLYNPTFGFYADLNSLFAENIKLLMQFTGLKDKNGKEIYEGDILSSGRNVIIVEYSEFYHSDGWEKIKGIGFWTFCNLGDIEVIGNIYENPELLEG